jgi:ABC-type multidrug transport system ATPase subunit
MELTIQNVSKQYGKNKWGLRSLNLTLNTGVWGLLGPNGAGKSTLMRILATITHPSQGQVLWNGQDIAVHPNPLRSVLGYLPQDFGVYPNLNAAEFLHYLAAVKGLDYRSANRRIEELLVLVNLVEARKQPLGSYSGGMKQRIGIAQALLNDPQLLIVDEPTVGLDPEERVRFRNLLTDLSGDRIVILSTHIVSDVEAAATQIAILDQGQLLQQAAPEALLQNVEGKVWEWTVPSSQMLTIRQNHLVSNMTRRSDGVRLRLVQNYAPSPEACLAAPNLEDAYLWVTASFQAGHLETNPAIRKA